jgi:hypothetical protein
LTSVPVSAIPIHIPRCSLQRIAVCSATMEIAEAVIALHGEQSLRRQQGIFTGTGR